MPIPVVAIVGSPNVGKSSLMNRLAGRRISIVDPTPGVTRDRISTLVEVPPPTDFEDAEPRLIELTDTGGYGVYTAEGGRFDDVGADLSTLTDDIEAQIKLATDRSDLILFVIDAQAGVTRLDEMVAALLRRAGVTDRVMLIANKVDSERWENDALEATRLGFGMPVPVSAVSNYRRRDFVETLWRRLPEEAGSIRPGEGIRIAIVGRRNAGKSTLVNTIAGEARVIVSEIAGTTRDAVDVRVEFDGTSVTLIDTAGVRKRKSFADDIEWYAHHRMLRSIRRADVALLLIDATVEVSQVDKRLAQELAEQHKPTVIVINKWDLVRDTLEPGQYTDYLTQELPGLSFAPIAFVTAHTGEGVRDMMAMAVNLEQQAGHREPTARVNEIMQEILSARGPSSRLGTRAKILYASQVGVHPPTIVLVVNHPHLFEGRYEQYLLNRLREHLPFSEVPIRLVFAQRKRRALEEEASA